MNHSDRSFSFKEIGREDDLVKAMTEHKWPLCYSFLFGKLLYINDGNSEDEPEYVAVAIENTGGHHVVYGREVGRIKPRELSAGKVRSFVRQMNSGKYTCDNQIQIIVQPTWHHSCKLCRLEEEQSNINKKDEANCMCMTEKKGPLSGLGHDHMHHGEHHMERHMECCGQNSFPLIGDKLPSIQVKTTQGIAVLS